MFDWIVRKEKVKIWFCKVPEKWNSFDHMRAGNVINNKLDKFRALTVHDRPTVASFHSYISIESSPDNKRKALKSKKNTNFYLSVTWIVFVRWKCLRKMPLNQINWTIPDFNRLNSMKTEISDSLLTAGGQCCEFSLSCPYFFFFSIHFSLVCGFVKTEHFCKTK